jgi:hypothetical protein
LTLCYEIYYTLAITRPRSRKDLQKGENGEMRVDAIARYMEESRWAPEYTTWREMLEAMLRDMRHCCRDIIDGLFNSLPYLLRRGGVSAEECADASLFVMKLTRECLAGHWTQEVGVRPPSIGRKLLSTLEGVSKCALWVSPSTSIFNSWKHPLGIAPKKMTELADETCSFWSDGRFHLWGDALFSSGQWMPRLKAASAQMLLMSPMWRYLAQERPVSEYDASNFLQWRQDHPEIWQTESFCRASLVTDNGHWLEPPTEVACRAALWMQGDPYSYLGGYVPGSGFRREQLERIERLPVLIRSRLG